MGHLLPLTQLVLTWVPAFIVGVLVGRYQERHKETIKMRDFADRYRNWYDRWAAVLVTTIAITALIGIVIAASATVTNGRQDRRADADSEARDKAFSLVQGCFDKYAQAQSASSQAVREASVIKDEATTLFNQALNDEGAAFKSVVAKLRNGSVTPMDVQRLYRTLDRRDRAGRAVERAQAALDTAREENPVPDAPSTFCSVKP